MLAHLRCLRLHLQLLVTPTILVIGVGDSMIMLSSPVSFTTDTEAGCRAQVHIARPAEDGECIHASVYQMNHKPPRRCASQPSGVSQRQDQDWTRHRGPGWAEPNFLRG
ncbi:hypothetical protein MAPG_06269 [Magnaporthiopsis poae ATCC 64411]|uniref:Uncharacterized protein n=1 Tax=Magnaporthiopsis poae (strain ATCC 64411 / 73-15) TaxID=644358 RepID=A0A0C4E1K5_MAGP6|nr:hypothetical protein MAPG_06269 [Magnaporthiopsis poae ATCC 64411]